MDYQAYLKSKEWWLKKRELLSQEGVKCFVCWDRKGPYEVHHKSYRRLGSERLEDLIVLCPKCHADLHGRLSIYSKRDQYSRLWNESTIMMKEHLHKYLAEKEKRKLRAKHGSPDVIVRKKASGADL